MDILNKNGYLDEIYYICIMESIKSWRCVDLNP
ncbi:hypothetical protein SAMN05421503_2797 [Terribacillus aidingensis]|uniref:Uncharacterized protein n=1 Tax=Terribacillus aidingensis TaxID=586416 RepID=A0A285P3T4_9BACI|nr:hypothetical protein SAMN05421503_2797 [Terribacillus aidingensis]